MSGGGGLSIGGIGLAMPVATMQVAPVGANADAAPTAAAATQPSMESMPSVVVNFSDAALHALALETASLIDSSTTQTMNDLAAAALLALLLEEQKRNGTVFGTLAAVEAYLLVQALG